jgi:hypothetical protein
MKLALKILKLFAILIITVTIILFAGSILLQEKVADVILKSLNKNISTKLEVGSFKLSFLRKFPNASLELKEVLVHSSSNFSSDLFTGINTDTLLAARFVSVEFKITDILNGVYIIESIGVKEGKLNLYTDKAGLVNYDISAKKEESAKEDFTIDLQRITLSEVKTSYWNLATSLIINGNVEYGRLKSRISGNDIDFTASADVQIDSIQLYNTRIRNRIATGIDVSLESSLKGVIFKKGTLKIEDFEFGLDGSISSDKNIDLNITGNNINISRIRSYLPEKYSGFVREYNPSGKLLVDCRIKGLISRTSNPHIEITTHLNEGHISYGKSDLSINDISFTGYYSNGSENHYKTSSVSIPDFKARLGSAEYNGSLYLSDFDKAVAEILLKGKIFPDELRQFFNLEKISTASGSVDLDLKIPVKLKHEGKYSFGDIIDMKPVAEMVFHSFTIGIDNNKMLLNQISGNLSVSKSVIAKNIQLVYEGQQINIDGKFTNLAEWLSGRPVQMIASGDVSFNRLIPQVFIKDQSFKGVSESNRTAFSLPGDVILDINFRIDSLDFKSFSSSNIRGTLNYKPRLLTFTSLNMESQKGTVSGNGFIVQNSNKSVVARANFTVKDIDVNKAFVTFNNFGQDFLKAENLAGSLSGSFSLLLPLDSMLKPQIKTLTAEGTYTLVDGALNNFEPVKQLSKFIELSELENINFEKLENDFFIKNNFLYIPQMEVKSSAVDLSVNGKHSFDNDYEYHIKMLLSEILSKKRKKIKNNVSEFGIVEDDGLGRTSLLLKIVYKGDEIKVGYDIKAAGSEIKTNIKAERQTLKTILNQEYGWFKNDTPSQQRPVEKSRFRITFEETDSLKASPDTLNEKKQGVLKNLFKKK